MLEDVGIFFGFYPPSGLWVIASKNEYKINVDQICHLQENPPVCKYVQPIIIEPLLDLQTKYLLELAKQNEIEDNKRMFPSMQKEEKAYALV